MCEPFPIYPNKFSHEMCHLIKQASHLESIKSPTIDQIELSRYEKYVSYEPHDLFSTLPACQDWAIHINLYSNI